MIDPGPRHYRKISLLTDYGTTDEFVGVVKAVIADLAPEAQVIDLTHDIPPYDVRAGSLALARCIGYVPAGIVIAVVDPGVGTTRRAIAVEVADGDGVMIGPDNGLLAPAVAMAGGAGRVVELTNPKYQLGAPGATFAGRDIFAPAAAHLCAGVPLTELGPLIDADLLMPATVPLPRLEDDRLIAEILWIDRYGNCQLNLGPDDLEAGTTTVQLRIGSPSDPGGVTLRSAKRSDTFADIGAGLGLVTDSYGMLAISLDRASAADELGVAAGDQVVIVAGEEPSGSSTPVQLGRR